MATPTAGVSFWATLGVLAVVVLGLAAAGLWQAGRRADPADAPPPRIPAGVLQILEQRAGIARIVDEVLCTEVRARITAQVGPRVDAAFDPVRARVPALADWHYSVLGEYVELGQAAAGRLAAAWEERLFGGAEEFERRLEAAIQGLDGELAAALRGAEARVREETADRLGLSGTALEPVLGHVLEPVRADIARRTELQAAKAGLLGGALAVRKLLVTLAGKTLAATGAKLALKTGSKWAAGAAGGAGAAALCSVVPVVGTVACGVGGALAAWFAFDAVAVNVDEALHREAFEAELRGMVETARDETAAALTALYAGRIDGLCARVRGRIRGLDEETLLRRLNRSPYEQLRDGETP
jgi:hypothetical protein